ATIQIGLVNKASHMPGNVAATEINAAPIDIIGITRDINVAGIERGPIVNLGIYNNVRLIVPSTGEQIHSFFTRVIGRAKIGVAIAGINFEATKLVDQPNVEHTGDRVRTVNGGSAVLQDVDVVDQPKWNCVEVDCITGKANRGKPTPVLQDQSFLSEKTAQVNFHAAVTAAAAGP